MPGKHCDGNTTPNLVRTPKPEIAAVACMGREAFLQGKLATDNPWYGSANNSQNKPFEEAWDRGFAMRKRGCCAR